MTVPEKQGEQDVVTWHISFLIKHWLAAVLNFPASHGFGVEKAHLLTALPRMTKHSSHCEWKRGGACVSEENLQSVDYCHRSIIRSTLAHPSNCISNL
jgi:hypothetical protein